MSYLALDIGGTNLRIGLGNGTNKWKKFQEIPLDNNKKTKRIISIIDNFLKKNHILKSNFKGIGVSIAGLVENNSVVKISENLNWKNVPLKKILMNKYKKKIFIETDVFCGAFFVLNKGEVKKFNSALYIAIGTGIGHSLIINKKIWKGSFNNANAIGHTIVTNSGTKCYCGLKNCLCMVASGKVQSSVNPPKGSLKALSQVLGNSITLIEPEIIVLTGGALNLKWFNLNKIKELIKNYTYPEVRLPKIIKSNIEDINLRGAALLIKHNL